jgi:hypothetical protein
MRCASNRGLTRFTMGVQARCERLHVQRASRVLATSRYSAERAQEFYRLRQTPTVVPELIDLAEWRRLLGEQQRVASRASRCSSWAGSTAASGWRFC